jgi:hypothetical protein
MKTIPRRGGKSVIKDTNTSRLNLAIALLLLHFSRAIGSFDVLYLFAHLFRLALDLDG